MGQPTQNSIFIALTQIREIPALLSWGMALAKSQSKALSVLLWEKGEGEAKLKNLKAESLAQAGDLAEALQQFLNQESSFISSRPKLHFFRLQSANANQGADLLKKNFSPSLFLFNSNLAEALGGSRASLNLWRRLPWDLMMWDLGEAKAPEGAKILLPAGGSSTLSALQLATPLVESVGGELAPLMVESDIGKDAQAVALRELKFNLQQAGVKSSERIRPKVALYDHATLGIAAHSDKANLILIGTESVKILRQLRKLDPITQTPLVTLNKPIALFKKAAKEKRGFFKDRVDQLFNWMPQLEFADRVDLFQRLKGGSRWNVDFIFMLGLAAGIASLGLIASLPAVIIGGMLVAPLMVPMVGLGLALIQGNLRLAREASRSIIYGFLLALVISFLFGLFSPYDQLSSELLSRGSPNSLDLFVAFFSGAAAAYAMARPNLMGAIAGVAVAAALVPPICTVGISVAQGKFGNGQGAAILFSVNLVAIILGAAFIFWRMGVHGVQVQKGAKLWVRRSLLGLVALAVIMSLPLAYLLVDQVALRNVAAPVSPEFRRRSLKLLNTKSKKSPVFLCWRSLDPMRTSPFIWQSLLPLTKRLEKILLKKSLTSPPSIPPNL